MADTTRPVRESRFRYSPQVGWSSDDSSESFGLRSVPRPEFHRFRYLFGIAYGFTSLPLHRYGFANAAAGSSRSAVGKKGGKSPSYDDWTKKDLLDRTREIDIEGRSKMTKPQLIKALRNH